MRNSRNTSIIVDLQFGSTGKGLLAGYLATKNQPDTIITAWCPNAGHTYIDANGRKMINTALPNGIVSPNLQQILLGPGSVINPENLCAEIEAYTDLIAGAQLMIHENAAVVTPKHRKIEAKSMLHIGSTMKGVGAAVTEKIARKNVSESNIARVKLAGTPLEGFVVSHEEYIEAVGRGYIVQVEGAQGYSLGINSGFYPHVTSRECTVAQLLSDCAIPLHMGAASSTAIYGTCRTYPIRVANRYDVAGDMVGYSGPCYDDQREMEWSELPNPPTKPELTTVTKLPRRIFTFSEKQIVEACRINSVDEIFMNFMNYMLPEDATRLIERVENITRTRVTLLGYGATHNDVFVRATDEGME